MIGFVLINLLFFGRIFGLHVVLRNKFVKSSISTTSYSGQDMKKVACKMFIECKLKLCCRNFFSLAYQKILSWEPLLELVSIDFEGERKSNLTVGDSLAMKVVVNYNGPKVSEYGFMSEIR